MGTDRRVVCWRCAIAQRDRAGRRAQHDGAIATGGAHIALRGIAGRREGGAVAAHPVHARSHVVHTEGIGLQHKNAAIARSRAERRNRRLQVVHTVGYGRASTQAQGAGCDVLVRVVAAADQSIRVQDTARRGGDAHFACAQLNVAHRHIGGRQQARRGCAARAQKHAGGALREAARARHHINAAAGGRRAGGAQIGRAREAHVARGQHAQVAAGALNVGMCRDVRARAQGLDQHVARSVGADGGVISRCGAVMERDAARCGAQHNGTIGCCGAHIALHRINDVGRARHRIGAHAVDAQAHVVHGQVVGFQQVNTAARGQRCQSAHRGFQVVHAGGNAGARVQAQAQRCDVLVAIVGRTYQSVCV